MGVRCALMLLVSLASLVPATALAVPLRVLSRTTLDVEVSSRWNGLALTGRLSDDDGQAVSAAELVVSVPGVGDKAVTTDRSGRYRVRIEGAEHEALAKATPAGAAVTLRARFAGDASRGPALTEARLHLDREILDLDVVVSPSRVTAGQAPRVLCALRHGAEPAPGMPLELILGPEPEQRLLTRTDAEGRATFRALPGLPAGPHRLQVVFPGTDVINRASATRTVLAMRRVRPTLDSVQVDDTWLTVSGRLEGPGGGGGLRLDLTVEDILVGNVISDAGGGFVARVSMPEISERMGPTRAAVRATFHALAPWETAAQSAPWEIDVPAPPRLPLAQYAVPALAAFALVGAAIAWRRGAGRRVADLLAALATRWQRRQRRATATAHRSAAVPQNASPPPLPAGSGEPRQAPGWVRLVDLLTRRPLADVDVRVDERWARTADDGSLDLSDVLLAPTIALSCPGYAPVILSGVRGLPTEVLLTPKRVLAARAFDGLLAALGSASDARRVRRFGTRTPREVAMLLESAGGPMRSGAAAARTVLAFERLYFGAPSAAGAPDAEAVRTALDALARDTLARDAGESDTSRDPPSSAQ